LKAIYTTEEALGRDGNIFYCPPKLGPILWISLPRLSDFIAFCLVPFDSVQFLLL
jgi:hypothetical protein